MEIHFRFLPVKQSKQPFADTKLLYKNWTACFSSIKELNYDKSCNFNKTRSLGLDQLAKRIFRSRYAHTPVKEHNEGPIDTVPSIYFKDYMYIVRMKMINGGDKTWKLNKYNIS